MKDLENAVYSTDNEGRVRFIYVGYDQFKQAGEEVYTASRLKKETWKKEETFDRKNRAFEVILAHFGLFGTENQELSKIENK